MESNDWPYNTQTLLSSIPDLPSLYEPEKVAIYRETPIEKNPLFYLFIYLFVYFLISLFPYFFIYLLFY